MKFAKILLVMAVLAPSAALSQGAPATNPGVTGGAGLGATNFAFLLPVFSFIALPLALGEDNNTLPPAPTPTPTTRTN